MQLFSRNKALAALSLGALVALGACGDDVTVPAPVNPPVAVTISPSNANVNVGASVDLAVAITGGASTPTLASCSTSSAAVATVAVQGGTACRVTGVSTGAVTITATTSGGQVAAASVTVNAPAPAISGIAISPAAQNVQVGGTFAITANPTTTAPGATVARGFVSSNTAVATVSATGTVTAVAPGQATITVTLTGTGTGLSQAVVTGQVAVTVVANPPAVTGVTVTPSSAAMVVGAAPVTGTATATAATGITPTFTAGSSNPGVATATVTSAGAITITAVGAGQAVITITAQSAGNASFAAASATAQIPVTVNAAAQVAVANITSAETNNPVDISNVSGQIQVALNLTTNNNVVRAVRLYICPVNGTCPTAAAAEQTFGAAGASNGQINMFINTADFSVASDWSSATTKFKNGQQNIVAQLDVANAAANNTLAILNLNNTDGFAAYHKAPDRAVVAGATSPNANLTYYGGPDAVGKGFATIVPVIYTAGRSVVSAVANITGAACPGTAFAFTGAGPWTINYGKLSTTDTLNTVTKYEACSGLSSGLDLGVRVASAIDNAQNNVAMLPTTSFKTNSSNVPAVAAPAIIRADYQNPTAVYAVNVQVTGALAGWVNEAYNFAKSTNLTGSTDANGVGLVAKATIQVQGCPYVSTAASKVWVTLNTNTGADVAECASDLSGGPANSGPYETRYTAVDLLGNSATATATTRFGVDKTKPLIRYVSTLDSNQTVYGDTTAAGPAATTALFQFEVLDERAGFDDATAATHFLTRANRFQRNGGVTSAFASCVVGTSPAAGVGSLFVTAPTCTPASAGSLGSVNGTTGYRSIAAVTPAGLSTAWREGYYTYRGSVVDRAGNSESTGYRYIGRNIVDPFSVAADLPLFPITSTFAGAFTGTFKDSLETNLTSLAMVYGDGDTLTFPAATAGATLWDNVITRDSTFSRSLPFTSGTRFYTNVETVSGTNTVAGSATTTPDSVGFWAQNFGGNGGFAFQSFVAGSITGDATGWATKNANLLEFAIVPTTAGFNAPAGGVKARATGNVNLLNSPFARVDFYRQAAAGRWEYMGSVDGAAAPCISESQAGCPVYVADNGTNRYFTFVLRSAGNGARSFSNIALDAVGTTSYRAIATTGTAGRALSTLAGAYIVAPPVSFRSR